MKYQVTLTDGSSSCCRHFDDLGTAEAWAEAELAEAMEQARKACDVGDQEVWAEEAWAETQSASIIAVEDEDDIDPERTWG